MIHLVVKACCACMLARVECQAQRCTVLGQCSNVSLPYMDVVGVERGESGRSGPGSVWQMGLWRMIRSMIMRRPASQVE